MSGRKSDAKQRCRTVSSTDDPLFCSLSANTFFPSHLPLASGLTWPSAMPYALFLPEDFFFNDFFLPVAVTTLALL